MVYRNWNDWSVLTVCVDNCCIVVLRFPTQDPFFSSSVKLTVRSLGVLSAPLEKNFISGHWLTVTSTRDGKSKLCFSEQKLVRLGKRWSSNISNFLKTISSFIPSSSFATISVTILQPATFILVSCARLFAVVDVTNFTNLSHLHTYKFVRFWKEARDGAK